MARWFISDTHFGHANIIRLSNRPFADVEEMNETMVENWNRVVKPGDTVYHLGDAVMGKFEENIKIISQLNGNKFLVPGNHDRVSSVEKESRRDRFRADYEANGFTILPEIVTGSIGGVPVYMSHYPFEGDSHDGDRFTHLRPKRYGMPVVHGHVHEKWKIRLDQFNVGVDVNNFTPVSEEEVAEWLRTL